MTITKRIFGATFLLTVSRGVVMACTIISAPILTKLLGPTPYGTMALISSSASFAVTVALLGIDLSYSRFFLSETGTVKVAVENFCWRFALWMSTMVAICACLILWFTNRAVLQGDPVMLIALFLTIIFGVVRIMAETRLRLAGKYRKMAFGVVFPGIGSVLLTIVLALYWRQDAWPLVFGSLFGTITTIVFFGILPLRALFNSSKLNTTKQREIILLGLPSLLSAVIYWVISSSDRWFIAAYASPTEVGIYSFVFNLAGIGAMLNSAITLTWFPEAIKNYEEDQKEASLILGRLWARLVGMLLLVWVMVTTIGGDILHLLVDARFHSGAVFIPLLAGGVLFYGITSIATTGMMLSKNLKPSAVAWTVTGIVNLLLNAGLVPKYGALGAAIANCLSFALAMAIVMYLSQRVFVLVIPWLKLFQIFVIAIAGGLLMAQPWHSLPFVSMSVKMPVAVVLCIVIIWRIAPDWLQQALLKVRS